MRLKQRLNGVLTALKWCLKRHTHPRGVRPPLVCKSDRFLQSFNPRTHVGCDMSLAICPRQYPMFQSTHPRGVRQSAAEFRKNRALVSIHAPTWGATSTLVNRVNAYLVSIHAPTWGATTQTATSATETVFQSTHPRGVRHHQTS